MLIREVADSGIDTGKLAALSELLKKRMEDESVTQPFSQDSFIKLAKSLKVNVTAENLGDLISQPPLSNLIEPLEPGSGVLRWKGDTEADTGMSVDQAQAVVNSNAKAALKRRS
jgi:hypothetical protein